LLLLVTQTHELALLQAANVFKAKHPPLALAIRERLLVREGTKAFGDVDLEPEMPFVLVPERVTTLERLMVRVTED